MTQISPSNIQNCPAQDFKYGGFPVSISARFLRLFSGTATLHVCCVICTGGTSGLVVLRKSCGGNRCAIPTLLFSPSLWESPPSRWRDRGSEGLPFGAAFSANYYLIISHRRGKICKFCPLIPPKPRDAGFPARGERD